MKNTRYLLRLKIKVGYRNFFRGNDAQVLKWAFGLLWLIIAMLGAFALGLVLFGRAYRSGGEAGLLAAANVSCVLAFVVLLLVSLSTSYRALFSSADLAIWLTAPIPLRAIFIDKLVEVIRAVGRLYVFAFLPALVGLGAAVGSGVSYYLLLLTLSGPLVGISAAVATTQVVFVVRHMRARTTKEAVAAVSIISVFGGLLATQLIWAAPATSAAARPGAPPLLHLVQPGALMARAVVRMSLADPVGAAVPALLILGISVAVFLIVVPLNERVYLEGYTRSQTAALSKRGTGMGRLLLLPRFVAAPIRAIFMKDVRTVCRDFGESVRLALGTCLAFLSLAAPSSSVLEALTSSGGSGLLETTAKAGMLLVSLILTYAFCLALCGFAREREGLWILHLAPVDRREITVAKMLVGFLPSLVIIELVWIVTGVAMKLPVGVLGVGVIAVAGALPGVNAIGVMLGAEFAKSGVAASGKFDQGGGEPLFGVLGIGYLAAVVALPLWPHLDANIHANPAVLWIATGFCASALALATPIALLTLASWDLEQLEVSPRVTDDVIAQKAERMVKLVFPHLD